MSKGKRAVKNDTLDDSEAQACAGKSLLELLKDRLDEYIDELMDSEAMEALKGKQIENLKGTADGLAQAIAIIERPYFPDTEVVKNDAMVRYEERNA